MILWLADYLGDDFFMTHNSIRWRTPESGVLISFKNYYSLHLTSRLFIPKCRNRSPLVPTQQPDITRGGEPADWVHLFRNVGKEPLPGVPSSVYLALASFPQR